jgi:hypothetical protein
MRRNMEILRLLKEPVRPKTEYYVDVEDDDELYTSEEEEPIVKRPKTEYYVEDS